MFFPEFCKKFSLIIIHKNFSQKIIAVHIYITHPPSAHGGVSRQARASHAVREKARQTRSPMIERFKKGRKHALNHFVCPVYYYQRPRARFRGLRSCARAFASAREARAHVRALIRLYGPSLG